MYDGVYPGNPRKYDNNSDPGMSLIYEKTDFIKLKNINLSYSLPKKWLNRIRIEGASVFFNAYNVFTATSYGGIGYKVVFQCKGIGGNGLDG